MQSIAAHPHLHTLPVRDLIILLYIVALGFALRDELRVPGLDDATALRHELRRREVW